MIQTIVSIEKPQEIIRIGNDVPSWVIIRRHCIDLDMIF